MKAGKLTERFKSLPFPKKGGGKSAAKPQKTAFKATHGAKFVLLIGDEGAILVYIKKNVVQSRQFVPDSSPQNLEELREALAVNPKAPILLAIDNMDQSYVQQTLPPVSKLSVGKLIKRRLERDFRPEDIKGAIMLGREETGRKDWEFLMVSIEKTPQVTVWLDFVLELPNRFKGIFLLSAETEITLRHLERAMSAAGDNAEAEWKFFVSHNKVGGFRQVILRKGKLLFTRMAQPINESNPEVVAGTIEQEMLSTIEYMKRLGYNPAKGLDVYIVAAAAIRDAITRSKFNASSIHLMTPYEVAGYLGIEGATQPADQFGDVILAAAIGCSPRHVLTLSTPQSQRFDTLHHISQFQRSLGALAAAGIFIYIGSLAFDLYTTYTNIEELQQRKAFQQNGLNKLRDEIKASDMNVEQSTDLIALYQLQQQAKLSPVPFIAKVGSLLRPPIVVKSFSWSLDTKETGAGTDAQQKLPLAQNAAAPQMEMVFTLQFPGVDSADAFKVVSKKVLDDFKETFKGYTVEFTHVPAQFSENERMDITFSDAQANKQIDFAEPQPHIESPDVQLTIKGPVMKEPSGK